MEISDIKWLHVEASSNCNAWCPACPRNNNGFGVREDLIEQDLSTERFREVLNELPFLDGVQFCGNYGDPSVAENIIELITLAKQHSKKIQIHTNGGARSTTWWSELAELLSDIPHDVWFGIDGLKGTHEIYRQGTTYDKVTANAQAFISNGGFATWQFIPYAHNETELKDCIRTSQRLGFKKFKLIKSYRNKQLAKHYRTGEEFELLPPKEFQHIIRITKRNAVVEPKNCMHLTQPGIYLNSLGKLSSCCYFDPVKNFDSIDELLYNTTDLTHPRCVESCGT